MIFETIENDAKCPRWAQSSVKIAKLIEKNTRKKELFIPMRNACRNKQKHFIGRFMNIDYCYAKMRSDPKNHNPLKSFRFLKPPVFSMGYKSRTKSMGYGGQPTFAAPLGLAP